MTKKKRIIYVVILAAFLVLWAAFVLVLRQTTAVSARQMIPQWSQTARQRISTYTRSQAQEMEIHITVEARAVPATQEEGVELLGRLAKKEPAYRYFLLQPDGMVLNDAGAPAGVLKDRAAMSMVAVEGYALAAFRDTASGEDMMVYLLPLEGGYLLAFGMGQEQFAEQLAKQLGSDSTGLLVFDNYGNQIYYDNLGTDSDAQRLRNELAAGASEFSASRQSEMGHENAARGGYYVYIRLDTPAGWFVGSFVPKGQIAPYLSSIERASAVVFASMLLLLVVVVVALDAINDREKARELKRVGEQDALTGLSNSAGMKESTETFLEQHRRTEYSYLCLDMASFRNFNTMYGYATGDDVLRVLGKVLKDSYFCAARPTGDVFTLLAKTGPDMVDELESRLRQAVQEELGQKYLEAINFKFGVYPILREDVSYRDMYDGAQMALRDAKSRPSPNVVVYGAELQKYVDRQKCIEINMLHALSKEEFLVYLQPQYEVVQNRCVAAEALVRWQSEQLGFVMPNDFVPLFEKNGFIVELDFYVLTAVFTMLRRQIKMGYTPLPIAVNQSRVTVTFPNYLDRLQNVLNQFADVPLQYVQLEVTESVLESNSKTVTALIGAIRDKGVSVAIDDFGSAYSSLATLRQLPVDTLKIDREFLYDAGPAEKGKAIVESIVNMSHKLGICVVCEGVETKQQLEFLRQVGCEYVQGFHLARPMPQEQYEQEYIGLSPDCELPQPQRRGRFEE